MNKRVVFISDFFTEHIIGGAELNNEELISILKERGHEVIKKQSHEVDQLFLETHNDCFFIISNFVNLISILRDRITERNEYIIYEHDHKYLNSRDPANYPDFKAPPEEIINLRFYQNAKAVFCQSGFHAEIIQKNTGLQNIVNVSGNLWDQETLDLLENISLLEKDDYVAIMDSPIKHKNTQKAIFFCKHKKQDYRLVASSHYTNFLKRLGANKSLAFFPSTPETLSRVVCEARMMGMKVITNDLVGATKEEWFELRGKQLVDVMREKRDTITELVLSFT